LRFTDSQFEEHSDFHLHLITVSMTRR